MKTYLPSELFFYVQEPTEDMEEATVLFTTKKCWLNDKCQSDDIGGHNMPGAILTSCGVADAELAESIFEVLDGFTTTQVRANLLAAGFEENADFSAFIKAFMS